MGCAQSKIGNEEVVTRCKERKQFMKDAVSARNAFAAAHSAYAKALKNTGAALSDYAHGEFTVFPRSLFPAALPPPPRPPPGLNETIIEEDEDEDNDDDSEFQSHNRLVRKSKSRGGRNGGKKIDDNRQEAKAQPPPLPQSVPENTSQMQPLRKSLYDYFFPTAENMTRGTDLEEAPRVTEEEEEQPVVEVERKTVEKSLKRPEESEIIELENDAPMRVESGRDSKKNKGVENIGEMRGVRPVTSSANAFTRLDDYFLKAYESALEVSKMLEATRLHYHSNFVDNRGHIDYAARIMRAITWNRSFRGIRNADDGEDDLDSEENETHATVLDKLLAWENKLYEEAKAGELMKIEYQKKVAHLNRVKKRGGHSDSLERAKAAVSHLNTTYIVEIQSMDSKVSEINRLRDEQLYIKLFHLVEEMAKMWKTMYIHHKKQVQISEVLDALDISEAVKETNDHHHERTIQLLAAVQEWHTQFCRMIDNQKEYIKALGGWLKNNLIPIESTLKEKVSSPPRVLTPPIQRLLRAWYDCLCKIPDKIARTAIDNFAAAISTIVQQQEKEIKLRDRCEETRKELERKMRQFEDWIYKYMKKRIPDGSEDTAHKKAVVERQFRVDQIKKRLEEEEAAYHRQC